MSGRSGHLDRLPRCCDTHSDWPTLAEHLVRDFTQIDSGDVLRELHQARQAAEVTQLTSTEALFIAELIARHQLMLLGGQVVDAARLDPERHAKRA